MTGFSFSVGKARDGENTTGWKIRAFESMLPTTHTEYSVCIPLCTPERLSEAFHRIPAKDAPGLEPTAYHRVKDAHLQLGLRHVRAGTYSNIS